MESGCREGSLFYKGQQWAEYGAAATVPATREGGISLMSQEWELASATRQDLVSVATVLMTIFNTMMDWP